MQGVKVSILLLWMCIIGMSLAGISQTYQMYELQKQVEILKRAK